MGVDEAPVDALACLHAIVFTRVDVPEKEQQEAERKTIAKTAAEKATSPALPNGAIMTSVLGLRSYRSPRRRGLQCAPLEGRGQVVFDAPSFTAYDAEECVRGSRCRDSQLKAQ